MGPGDAGGDAGGVVKQVAWDVVIEHEVILGMEDAFDAAEEDALFRGNFTVGTPNDDGFGGA